MRLRSAAALLLSCCVASAARAQGAVSAVPARQAISINPLGLPFKIVSGEFERAVAAGASLGAGANYVDIADVSYLSADAKLRYYPQERALRGFSVGGSVGFARVSDDECGDGFDCGSSSESGVTVGVLVDYNWLLGPRRRFFVGTGVGAKRIFVNGDDFSGDVSVAYPTVRLQVGYAF